MMIPIPLLKSLRVQCCSSVRMYSKNYLRRRPVAVFNLPNDTVSSVPENITPISKLQSKTDKNSTIDMYKTGDSKFLIPPYDKLQKNDARFTKTLTIIKNRNLREKKGQILLEGKRLINDAISAGVELKTIYFSREKDLADIKLKTINNVQFLKVFYKTLSVWSDLKTSPGVMGVFKKPSMETMQVLSEPVIPVTILCDNIREPGNLGSIIRNAAAAGCRNILLTKGCVDPWETKVLRAGCGGHFRIPIVNNIDWTHLPNFIPKHSTIFVADNTSEIESSQESPEFICYDEIQEESNEKKYFELGEDNQPVEVDETYNEPSELEKFEDVNLPCYLYSSITYPKDNIVLYVGGETHGIDLRIIKMACEYGGRKVKIPLENDMDSLNSSFAMTIVLYEIKKQLAEKYVIK